MSEKKQIYIEGTNNRYQMKKVCKVAKKEKRDVELPEDVVENNSQKEKDTLCQLFMNGREISNNWSKYIYECINVKRNSYLQQDKRKERCNNLTNDSLFESLLSSNLLCFYCLEKIKIVYTDNREMKQWTVDRINNDIGHLQDNIVITCLECNIEKCRKNHDKFLFTKQLKIIKGNSENTI